VLAGIGFTMSIFITNLAFANAEVINQSKLAILVASFASALTGLIILFRLPPFSTHLQDLKKKKGSINA
jgi:Na+:H+ antiporter, NhaA family